MGDFKKLEVWKLSKDLAVEIYKITEEGRFSMDFRFRDQIRAAAVSVASNIAEGEELQTNKQSVNFFFIAKGSIAEIITQLIIAEEIGYLSKEYVDQLTVAYDRVSRMLYKLILVRKV